VDVSLASAFGLSARDRSSKRKLDVDTPIEEPETEESEEEEGEEEPVLATPKSTEKRKNANGTGKRSGKKKKETVAFAIIAPSSCQTIGRAPSLATAR
jgi:hypothetical protein